MPRYCGFLSYWLPLLHAGLRIHPTSVELLPPRDRFLFLKEIDDEASLWLLHQHLNAYPEAEAPSTGVGGHRLGTVIRVFLLREAQRGIDFDAKAVDIFCSVYICSPIYSLYDMYPYIISLSKHIYIYTHCIYTLFVV